MRPQGAEHIRSGLPHHPAGASTKALPWATILGSKEVLLISLSYFAFCYAANIFFTWFFIYLSTVRGLDLKSSSFFGMLPFLAMAVCSPVGGWISDRLTKRYGKRTGRCGIAVVCIGLSALFIALGMLVADARLASIVLAAGRGALYLFHSSLLFVAVGGRGLFYCPEFLLVGDGRHRRPFGRNRFRRNEYDRAIWRRRGPFSHSIAGRAIWLVGGVPGGRRPGCRGLSRLAVCESRADTAWEVRGKDLTI